MFHQIWSYLKFLLQSTNQHGVHSPFVYHLVTQCFYDRTYHLAYRELGDQRSAWSEKIRNLEAELSRIGEHGDRSTLPKGSLTTVSGLGLKQAELLNRLVRFLKVERILEFGSSLGLKSAAMATFNEVEVISIDSCAITTDLAQQNLSDWGLTNVQVLGGTLATGIENISSQGPKKPFDLIYIDLAHSEKAALQSFRMLLPFTHNDTLIIFEGVHDSLSAEKVWEEIIRHPEVRVCIDTFRWGIVFFRREQAKEHFIIRV